MLCQSFSVSVSAHSAYTQYIPQHDEAVAVLGRRQAVVAQGEPCPRTVDEVVGLLDGVQVRVVLQHVGLVQLGGGDQPAGGHGSVAPAGSARVLQEGDHMRLWRGIIVCRVVRVGGVYRVVVVV